MKWFYLISVLLIGSIFGYSLARFTLPPETIYQETHYFDPPITLQEGNKVYLVFSLKEKYYSVDVNNEYTGKLNEITFHPNMEYFRNYKTTKENE